jgi:hypothetical protein
MNNIEKAYEVAEAAGLAAEIAEAKAIDAERIAVQLYHEAGDFFTSLCYNPEQTGAADYDAAYAAAAYAADEAQEEYKAALVVAQAAQSVYAKAVWGKK